MSPDAAAAAGLAGDDRDKDDRYNDGRDNHCQDRIDATGSLGPGVPGQGLQAGNSTWARSRSW
jgi:hypothetical protein